MIRQGDHQLVLPIPDRFVGRPNNWTDLRFDNERDGVTFASDLLEAVDLFMEEMFKAFEDAKPVPVPGFLVAFRFIESTQDLCRSAY